MEPIIVVIVALVFLIVFNVLHKKC
jgi:hypothetical protein